MDMYQCILVTALQKIGGTDPAEVVGMVHVAAGTLTHQPDLQQELPDFVDSIR